ncbi:MAG: hypothetical protein ABIJ72_02740 [bacterium]
MSQPFMTKGRRKQLKQIGFIVVPILLVVSSLPEAQGFSGFMRVMAAVTFLAVSIPLFANWFARRRHAPRSSYNRTGTPPRGKGKKLGRIY